MRFLQSIWFPVIIFIVVGWVSWNESGGSPEKKAAQAAVSTKTDHEWEAPDINSLGSDSAADLIRYGKDLIANTAFYFGPRGKISSITNGMDCQNCHIESGARAYGNCFSAVSSTYPQYRPRSGRVESIEFRVNDCMQRSLNGHTIDSLSREMRAMVAYLKWLGAGVPKGVRPTGAGTQDLELLKRAADAKKGKQVFDAQCSRCHGVNGEGQKRFDSSGYAYPPLWGSDSYNTGAGLYRLSKLSAYVHDNMPYGISSHENPQLTVEQSWDVAAFISSQPRPQKRFSEDWPKLGDKAFDYPFGPYTDHFNESQHKYGPFEPIKKEKAAMAAAKK